MIKQPAKPRIDRWFWYVIVPLLLLGMLHVVRFFNANEIMTALGIGYGCRLLIVIGEKHPVKR